MAGIVHVIPSRKDWDSKLLEATTNGKIVVVDFTAKWCGPCRMIAPIYEELSEKYPQLVFLKVDIDESQDLGREWEIDAVPTFIFFKDGKAIDKCVGADKVKLEGKIAAYAETSQQETIIHQ